MLDGHVSTPAGGGGVRGGDYYNTNSASAVSGDGEAARQSESGRFCKVNTKGARRQDGDVKERDGKAGGGARNGQRERHMSFLT